MDAIAAAQLAKNAFEQQTAIDLENNTHTPAYIGGIIGGCLGVGLVIGIIVGIILYCKKQQQKNSVKPVELQAVVLNMKDQPSMESASNVLESNLNIITVTYTDIELPPSSHARNND